LSFVSLSTCEYLHSLGAVRAKVDCELRSSMDSLPQTLP